MLVVLDSGMTGQAAICMVSVWDVCVSCIVVWWVSRCTD